MIKNIIFDIGNVLSDFCWRDFLSDKGFDKEMIERIGRASILTDSWYEFDKGVLSDEEVVELFVKNDPKIENEIHIAFDNVEGMVRLKPETISWIKELKVQGYKLYYLSNFSHKAEVQCPLSLSFIPLLDGGILSYKVRMTKPDPMIYKTLLMMYDLKAEECVFIDDTLKNVEAAEKLGIHGIQYKSHGQVCEDLQRMLSL